MSDALALTFLWFVPIAVAAVQATVRRVDGVSATFRMDSTRVAAAAASSAAAIVVAALIANAHGGSTWQIAAGALALAGAAAGSVHLMGWSAGSALAVALVLCALLPSAPWFAGTVCILAAVGLAALVPRILRGRAVAVLMVGLAAVDVVVVGAGATDAAVGSLSSGPAAPFAMVRVGPYALGGIDIAAAGLLGTVVGRAPRRHLWLAGFAAAQAALIATGATTAWTLPALVPAAAVACAWLYLTRSEPGSSSDSASRRGMAVR